MRPLTQPFKKRNRQWRRIQLHAPQLAKREHEHIAMLFNCVFMAAGRPSGANVWMTGIDNNGGASVYLSPRTTSLLEELIEHYHADTCDAPSAAATLLAGHGYPAYDRHPNTPRSTTTARRFLPARYMYRSVRALTQESGHEPWPPDDQMAPFVRRFAQAWALTNR